MNGLFAYVKGRQIDTDYSSLSKCLHSQTSARSKAGIWNFIWLSLMGLQRPKCLSHGHQHPGRTSAGKLACMATGAATQSQAP